MWADLEFGYAKKWSGRVFTIIGGRPTEYITWFGSMVETFLSVVAIWNGTHTLPVSNLSMRSNMNHLLCDVMLWGKVIEWGKDEVVMNYTYQICEPSRLMIMIIIPVLPREDVECARSQSLMDIWLHLILERLPVLSKISIWTFRKVSCDQVMY